LKKKESLQIARKSQLGKLQADIVRRSVAVAIHAPQNSVHKAMKNLSLLPSDDAA
jgi:hypothetical protein